MIRFSQTGLAMMFMAAWQSLISSPTLAQQPSLQAQQPSLQAQALTAQPPTALTVPRVSPRFALISAKGNWLEVHQTSFYSSYTHQTYSVYRTVTRRVIVNGKVKDVTSQVPEMRTRLVQDIKSRVNRMNVPRKGTRFFDREGRPLPSKKIEELFSGGTFPVVIFDATAPGRSTSAGTPRLPTSPSTSPSATKPPKDPNQFAIPPFYRQILAADAIIAVLAPPAP